MDPRLEKLVKKCHLETGIVSGYGGSYVDKFPYQEPREGEMKFFQFDHPISSKKVIEEITKAFYKPATLTEYLTWMAENQAAGQLVIILGTAIHLRMLYLFRATFVPSIYGFGRNLFYDAYGGKWPKGTVFPAIRPKKG